MEAPQESLLIWYFKALGIRYAFLLPLVALICLALVVLVAVVWKHHSLTALLALLIPLPVYFGIVGCIDGLAASFQVLAHSTTVPHMNELAAGGSMSLATVQVGMYLALPTFLLAIAILLWRSLTEKEVVLK